MQKYEEFHGNTSAQSKLINPNNFTYRLLFEVFGKYLYDGSSVLDIGCGAGTISLYIASLGKNVTGLDISGKAIKEAKKSAKYLGLKSINFEVMDFPYQKPKGDYDTILCFEVLEHLKDDERALKEIHKLLKKDGSVIISVPSENAPLYRTGYAKEFDKQVGHVRRYTLEKLLKKLKENNFEIMEYRKTEGVFRNFLFLNPHAGKLVRGMKSIIGNVFTAIDNIAADLFGESQIIIVARKK